MSRIQPPEPEPVTPPAARTHPHAHARRRQRPASRTRASTIGEHYKCHPMLTVISTITTSLAHPHSSPVNIRAVHGLSSPRREPTASPRAHATAATLPPADVRARARRRPSCARATVQDQAHTRARPHEVPQRTPPPPTPIYPVRATAGMKPRATSRGRTARAESRCAALVRAVRHRAAGYRRLLHGRRVGRPRRPAFAFTRYASRLSGAITSREEKPRPGGVFTAASGQASRVG